MTRSPIRIDPEFRRLIAPLSVDEYAQLEANLIGAGGARDPLVAWKGLLLDGHNRFEICTRLDLTYKVWPITLADRQAARIWIRWNQLGRRNLTDDQRAMVVAALVEELAAQSKRARASKAVNAREVKAGRRKPILVDTASTKITGRGRIRTKTSRRARVSERKVKLAQTVKRCAPALAAKVAAGEITLADAARQLRPDVRAAQLAATIWPDGKHGVILADPPWKPDEGLLDPTRRIENQYPTMTLAELVALRPRLDALADADCVLLLWTTTQKIADAAALVDAWGFTVKSGAVWVKPSVGMGYWFRGRHELLILATRGTPMTPLEADRPDSVIAAGRRPASMVCLCGTFSSRRGRAPRSSRWISMRTWSGTARMETKEPGADLPEGQRIALEAFASRPRISVVHCAKRAEQINGFAVWAHGQKTAFPGDYTALVEWCRMWMDAQADYRLGQRMRGR